MPGRPPLLCSRPLTPGAPPCPAPPVLNQCLPARAWVGTGAAGRQAGLPLSTGSRGRQLSSARRPPPGRALRAAHALGFPNQGGREAHLKPRGKASHTKTPPGSKSDSPGRPGMGPSAELGPRGPGTGPVQPLPAWFLPPASTGGRGAETHQDPGQTCDQCPIPCGFTTRTVSQPRTTTGPRAVGPERVGQAQWHLRSQ